jgi:hypothetical protein
MFKEREALEYLVGLGTTEIIEVDGKKFSTKQIYAVKDPKPAHLTVSTLSALVEYLKSDLDIKSSEKLLVHVISPEKVALYSELREDKDRETYIVCEALTPNNIVFDRFIDTDKFNIMLQSGFVNRAVFVDDMEYDFKKLLLQVTGCIRDAAVKEYGDDGISQTATIKVGAATVSEVKVPNPVVLAPYRTFPEIEQPASKFIFRMESGPKAALFEADGGAWRNEAMNEIKNYLQEMLSDLENVQVIS